jgi:hypothetical protein
MKKMISIALFMAFTTVSVSSQIRLTDKDFNKQEDDSILKAFFKMQAERQLHKDNKDSAWINDMNALRIESSSCLLKSLSVSLICELTETVVNAINSAIEIIFFIHI